MKEHTSILKKIHLTKKKTILCAAVVLILIVLIGALYPAFHLKKGKLSSGEGAPAALTGTAMEKTDGDQLIAEGEKLKLYLNPATMGIKVTGPDKMTWLSYVKGSNAASDKALIVVNYLGEDNNLYSWDSDTYCAQLDSYEVESIENGVKIAMDINEGESNRFYEYLPKKMSIERYEQMFVGGLDAALANGEIESDVYNRYMTTLGLVYKKSVVEECYAVTYLGNPPTSATKQLIAVASMVGYTHEMLEEDAETFGFALTKAEIAQFKLNLYLTLENDELIVRVPSSEMVSLNPYYVIQNVEVLPNFGACTPDKQEEGYLFVPDGAGALLELNTYRSGVTDYSRAVCDNDYFKDYYYRNNYPEELTMPVFGMIYGELGAETQSYLAIIEEGADTSYVCTKLASTSADGATTNKVYSKVDISQFMWAKVYGAYSDNAASYLVKTPAEKIDYKVRYRFFGKKSGYYDMAVSYREYLAQRFGRELSYRDRAEVYLDVLGSLNVRDHFFGVPYSKTISMTTYSQLQSILQELEQKHVTVSYEGMFNGGMDNELYDGCETVSKNGSKKDLKALQEYADDRNVTIAFGVTPERVYEDSLGYRASTHAVKDYANVVATISRYSLHTGLLAGYTNSSAAYYELLSPYYLGSAVEKFLKKADGYEDFYLPELGHLVYADYDNSDMVSIQTGNRVIRDVLQQMSEKHHLIMSDPFVSNLAYTSYVTDISRESSDYATFAYTIPFRQLAMNGLTEYATVNVNMSARDADYYILQAAELGSIPKFTVTWEKEDPLKHTDYSYLYAVCFANQKELIDQTYAACEDIMNRIGTTQIIGHRLLEENVFETEYAGGTKVVVNYNLYDVTLADGRTIPAEGYEIEEGKE